MEIIILRNRSVCQRMGIARSTSYDLVARKLLTPPVKISERASGWPAAEVEAIVSARVAGADDERIRTLVAQLVAARPRIVA